MKVYETQRKIGITRSRSRNPVRVRFLQDRRLVSPVDLILGYIVMDIPRISGYTIRSWQASTLQGALLCPTWQAP